MKTIIFDLDGTLVDLARFKCFVRATELMSLRKKYRLALVTGASRKETLSALRQFRLDNLFGKDKKFVITKDEVPASKKTGAPFRKIMSMLCGPAIFIGDSQNDALGCARADLPCILIKRSQSVGQQKINFKKALLKALRKLDKF